MNTGQILICAVIAVLAGFVGGRISNWRTRCPEAEADTSADAAGQSPAAIPGRVTAREFVLVDKAGNERILLGVNEHNVAGLHLYSVEGTELLSLAADEVSWPNLAMYDSAGKPRLVQAVLPDGTPDLTMYDSAGKARLSMGTNPGGTGLTINNSAGKVRLAMAVYKSETPDLTTWDSAGKKRATLGVFKDDPYLRIVKSQEWI